MIDRLVTKSSEFGTPTIRPIVSRPGEQFHATLAFRNHGINAGISAFEVNALPIFWIGIECAQVQPLGMKICETLKPTCVRKYLQSTFDHALIMRGFSHVDE